MVYTAIAVITTTHSIYMSGGADALKSIPKSSRIPRVPRKFMKRIGRMAHKEQKCRTTGEMKDFIIKVTGCRFSCVNCW